MLPQTTLRSYPAYKPSGVPWLTDVPEHWDLRRFKFFYREADERSSTGSEELMSVSHKTGVTPRKQNVTMFLAESNVGYKVCRPGDIVINTMWAYMAALGVAWQKGLVSPSYAVYRPLRDRSLNPDYVDLLLRIEAYRTAYLAGSIGITDSRLRLYPEQFLGIPMLCPPLAEQAAIVRYLDHADQIINRYIGAKERLIALLEEQRQAVIHQAVTRGLDPDAPLRHYDDWCDAAPQHWSIQRLRTLCSMKSGDGITTETILPEGPYPVYGGNGIRGYSKHFNRDGQFALIGRQGALCGNVHTASGKFWASEHAVVASLNVGHSFDWFVALLEAMNLNQYSIAAAQPGLSVERVMNLSVPVPASDEQAQIGERSKQVDANTSSAVLQVQQQIDLVNEYRTRLIADAVTGQIDVRHSGPAPITPIVSSK